jgi:hypothetical protein
VKPVMDDMNIVERLSAESPLVRALFSRLAMRGVVILVANKAVWATQD